MDLSDRTDCNVEFCVDTYLVHVFLYLYWRNVVLIFSILLDEAGHIKLTGTSPYYTSLPCLLNLCMSISGNSVMFVSVKMIA